MALLSKALESDPSYERKVTRGNRSALLFDEPEENAPLRF
jgi:hypothetical protein